MVKKFLAKLKQTDLDMGSRYESPSSTRRVKSLAKLGSTPSMTMLSEAAEALSQCPSALKKLADGTSTGGVYQVSRSHLYKVPGQTVQTKPAVKRKNVMNSGSRLKQLYSQWQNPETTSNVRDEAANPSYLSDVELSISKENEPMDEMCDLSNGFDHLDLRNRQPKRMSPVRAASTAGAIGLHRCRTDQGYEQMETPLPKDEVHDTRLRSVRSHVERKRSFSASFVNELEQEIKAVTSNVAIFKPEDEETGFDKVLHQGSSPSDNHDIENPTRKGLIIGSGARRERAAYALENQYFAPGSEFNSLLSVPPTVLTRLATRTNGVLAIKRGSLQKYVTHDASADERPDLVSKASPSEVHKIGILDLRIFNTDRHGGNILCQIVNKHVENEEPVVKLFPIDHALSLPDWRYLSEAYFDWQYYANAKEPFDDLSKAYVEAIDIDADQQVLKELGINRGSRATNKICTLALKVGVKHGLVLADLGTVFSRPYPPGHKKHDAFQSPLEIMLDMAFQETYQGVRGYQSILGKREKSDSNLVRLTKAKSVNDRKEEGRVMEKRRSEPNKVKNTLSPILPPKKVWPTGSLEYDSKAMKTVEVLDTHNGTDFVRQLDHLGSMFDTDDTSDNEILGKGQGDLVDFGENFTFDLIVDNAHDKVKSSEVRRKPEDTVYTCEFEVSTSDSTHDVDAATSVNSGSTPMNCAKDIVHYHSLQDFVKIQQESNLTPEENIFGTFVPRDEFYINFEKILNKYFIDHKWKQWVV